MPAVARAPARLPARRARKAPLLEKNGRFRLEGKR